MFSTSIAIREIPIKTMFGFRMTQSERWSWRKQTMTNAAEDTGKGGVYTLLVTQPLWKSVEVPQSTKNKTATYSVSIPSGNTPKGFHTCRAKGGEAISHMTQQWTLTFQARCVHNCNGGTAVRGQPTTFWLPLWHCRKNLRLELLTLTVSVSPPFLW